MIYLDNAAAQKPLQAAVYAMNSVLQNKWANPNSAHRAGREAYELLEKCRESVARCLNCLPSEVVFTSSASEAASVAMRTLYMTCENVTVGATEHDAVVQTPWRDNDPNRPARGQFPRKNGFARMMANNETGEVYGELVHMCRNYPDDVIFTDATAAVGHIPVDFGFLGVDYLCADGMKFGAVPGCGVLLVRHDRIFPQHIMHRPTPHLALIAAFAAALEMRTSQMSDAAMRVNTMRKRMEERLSQIPGARLNAQRASRLPGYINLSFFGVEGAALAGFLSQQGVCVSTGAACSSGDLSPSRVLLASGYDEQRARSAIRISIGEENTLDECLEAADLIAFAVEHLRTIS